jgi:ABC-2 type transport system ATP-binding protein
MLELHRDSQTLEDVFRSLTIGDERRNRQLTASGQAQGADDDEDDDAAEDEDEDEAESPKSADASADAKVAKDERS